MVFSGNMIYNLSESTVRGRFVNMRTTFMKNDKLICESKSSGKSSDDIYKSKWPLFESLKFYEKALLRHQAFRTYHLLPKVFPAMGALITQKMLSHSSETHDGNLNIPAKVSILLKPVTESYMASDLSGTEQIKTIVTNISDNLYFDENLRVSDNYLFIIYYENQKKFKFFFN